MIKSSHPHVATRFLPLDLGSQASVRETAATINADVEKIDLLINNAAAFFASYSKTVDGIEKQFGINHIGHFLFTNSILGKFLAAGAGARIVNVSSSGHLFADVRLDDWNFQVRANSHRRIQRLEDSKLMLFRMAKVTTRPRLTARAKPRIFSSRSLWQKGLRASTSTVSRCALAVSPHISTHFTQTPYLRCNQSSQIDD